MTSGNVPGISRKATLSIAVAASFLVTTTFADAAHGSRETWTMRGGYGCFQGDCSHWKHLQEYQNGTTRIWPNPRRWRRNANGEWEPAIHQR
jgi:hypothetical protein